MRLNVELIPYGDESRKKIVGNLVLANVANIGLGMYRYAAVYKDDHSDISNVFVNHARRDGMWVLIEKILSEEDSSKKEDLIFKSLEERM